MVRRDIDGVSARKYLPFGNQPRWRPPDIRIDVKRQSQILLTKVTGRVSFRITGRVSDWSWKILVGVAGFEPATPSSRTRCATRLRYTPISLVGGLIPAASRRCKQGSSGRHTGWRRAGGVPPAAR
jgi:hypothetical protein